MQGNLVSWCLSAFVFPVMTVRSGWRPWLGAIPEQDGVRFRVWASTAREVELCIEAASADGATAVVNTMRLELEDEGMFVGHLRRARAGDLYRYRLDDRHPMPDPASRFQPLGVHGPSEIVDPRSFLWHDQAWTGVRDRTLADVVFYELHVGTFTPEGTFAGAERRLPSLRDLGVTAIELMPVADVPGDRNWGYDGAALFAPARCYGRPDDLRRLVDAAHQLGLAVVLDVVYNHFGPDGFYAAAFSPQIFSSRHSSPWGAGVNFDGPGSDVVRRMLIENAWHWVHEYHVDGFRLDATHAIVDDSPTAFVSELAAAIHGARPEAPPIVIAEDSRNLAHMIREHDGSGVDGVWADDLHHVVHVMLTGESDGYYQDYAGTAGELARTIEQGWLYTGQHSAFLDVSRGTDPSGIPPGRFVVSLQTHDQIGNRAYGERLHHLIDAAAWRAASVLLLLAPETPLLFMGQEWAASTPFLYFTDHTPTLGEQVTSGRRHEFGRFARFADADARERIPDPQNRATFESSRLRWDEIDREPHAGTLRLYRRLLALRRETAGPAEAGLHDRPAPSVVESGFSRTFGVAPGETRRSQAEAVSRASVKVLDEQQVVVALRRGALTAIVCLRGPGGDQPHPIALPGPIGTTRLDTEDPDFCPDPQPIAISGAPPAIRFRRPGALVFARR